MRIETSISSGHWASRLQRAFTMVEVAISLGVIGFALVAIVGILPRGLNAQRENRQDTIVNQDGAYLLEVIKGGVRGIDDLTNYVDYIVVTSSNLQHRTQTRTVWAVPRLDQTVAADWPLTNGHTVVSLLSLPKYTGPYTTNGNFVTPTTNEVTAYMWAMGGSALEQGNGNRLVAFRYKVSSQIIPFAGYNFQMTNFVTNALTIDDAIFENQEHSNSWAQARQLTNNLNEVVLRLDWPLRPDDSVAANHTYQIFRTFVNAKTDGGIFQPQKYTFVR